MDFLGMMTAGTYTFAAVNAELTGDPGLTVSNADCLGRTALDTVDAAFAGVGIQGHRMKSVSHSFMSLLKTVQWGRRNPPGPYDWT